MISITYVPSELCAALLLGSAIGTARDGAGHVETPHRERGIPPENGDNERFNGTLRREVVNAEWFHTTKQAQIVINT